MRYGLTRDMAGALFEREDSPRNEEIEQFAISKIRDTTKGWAKNPVHANKMYWFV